MSNQTRPTKKAKQLQALIVALSEHAAHITQLYNAVNVLYERLQAVSGHVGYVHEKKTDTGIIIPGKGDK